ncbi:Gfo/Idh/MocA family protein [Pelagibacterium limicola]|uniref:Gfo/Idh/MocA family protein n=1 Tax=Pelagibacterium limicola TaxID=2791022 RepID=UPI0018AFECC7|nr:Gfo/Idh/MocA family oxidoreductase [Pelagibacterium limicola]
MSIPVGLIGLGEVAQLMHLPLLADDARFRIAVVNDLSPGLTTHVAARYGARAAESPEAVINDPSVEAVFILTPDYLHADLVAQAIAAKKHVFIEKPVCLNLNQLEPLLALHKDNPRIVFVGYMRRYARPFLALKKRMPALEKIRHVRVRDIIRESQFFIDQTRPVVRATDIDPDVVAEGRARAVAMLREVMGEDAPADAVRAYQVLTGLASHSFSAMRELLGMPHRVAAARQHGGETVMVWFDYGHFTALYEAVISDVAVFDSGIEILTQNQRFSIGYDTPYIRNLPTKLEITTSSQRDTGTETIGPFYEDPFRIELDAFHHSVTTGRQPKTDLADSRFDLELFRNVGRAFLENEIVLLRP